MKAAPKPYKLLKIENGREWREYENGDIRDQRGTLVVKPARIRQITAENSAAMNERRKEKILQAVEAGLMKVTDAPDPYEAISRLVAKRARVAMHDEGRAGNDAAKIVLAALDALPERRAEMVQTQRHVYEIDPETMVLIEEMARERGRI